MTRTSMTLAELLLEPDGARLAPTALPDNMMNQAGDDDAGEPGYSPTMTRTPAERMVVDRSRNAAWVISTGAAYLLLAIAAQAEALVEPPILVCGNYTVYQQGLDFAVKKSNAKSSDVAMKFPGGVAAVNACGDEDGSFFTRDSNFIHYHDNVLKRTRTKVGKGPFTIFNRKGAGKKIILYDDSLGHWAAPTVQTSGPLNRSVLVQTNDSEYFGADLLGDDGSAYFVWGNLLGVALVRRDAQFVANFRSTKERWIRFAAVSEDGRQLALVFTDLLTPPFNDYLLVCRAETELVCPGVRVQKLHTSYYFIEAIDLGALTQVNIDGVPHACPILAFSKGRLFLSGSVASKVSASNIIATSCVHYDVNSRSAR